MSAPVQLYMEKNAFLKGLVTFANGFEDFFESFLPKV